MGFFVDEEPDKHDNDQNGKKSDGEIGNERTEKSVEEEGEDIIEEAIGNDPRFQNLFEEVYNKEANGFGEVSGEVMQRDIIIYLFIYIYIIC